MVRTIKQIGEECKAKRKELNLSLQEVEHATSIRSAYIEAIEEGREERFLSSVYMLGFFRQYADFLGMDGDKMVRDNPEVFDGVRAKHDFSYGIGTLEVRGSIGGGVRWVPNLIRAVLIVAIIIATYCLAKYGFGLT
ncbi:MAG: helix-turn-helix domain-containing protein [Simkaniaceae bacterium]|nr:helix-turn-helix domain-containing protein [Simkaniaceae bacterium]